MKLTKEEIGALADILENPMHSIQLSSELYKLLEDSNSKVEIEEYDLVIEKI
jgi:hypothetical protein|tara:strand:+ start:288 stop:443 length:156 start_codon:yes stop_codon:yes gene_type:complete